MCTLHTQCVKLERFDKSRKNSLSFEECDVEQGGIEVDKLKEVHLGSIAVIMVALCAVKFCRMYECRKSEGKKRRGGREKIGEGKRGGGDEVKVRRMKER